MKFICTDMAGVNSWESSVRAANGLEVVQPREMVTAEE
jgi:hypothetical protein